MSMKVWFLTGNEGKVREANKIFNQHNFELEQMNLDFLEPQVDSLEEVAKEKMKQAMAFLPDESDALFVEDAGLFVEALNDFPGVFSSYALKTIIFFTLILLSLLMKEFLEIISSFKTIVLFSINSGKA